MSKMQGIYARWSGAGFGDAVIPVLPHAKNPAQFTGAGWTGMRGWLDAASNTDAWGGWPAHNVGLRTARFPAVDVDIDDKALADRVAGIVQDLLGPAPVRTRDARCALLYRLADGAAPVKVSPLIIKAPDGTAAGVVELIGIGRQLAVEGEIRNDDGSVTGYVWDEMPVRDLLEEVNTERVVEMFAALKDALSGDYEMVGGDALSLAGDGGTPSPIPGGIEALKHMLEVAPNDLEEDSRDQFVRIMHGVKGCVPEADHEEAYAAFLGWAHKWPHMVKGTELAHDRECWRIWNSIHVPKSGWRYLTEPEQLGAHAQSVVAWAFDNADEDEIEAVERAVELAATAHREAWAEDFEDNRYQFAGWDELERLAEVEPDWLIENLALRGRGSMIVGPSGSYKSTLAFMLAVAKAGGLQRIFPGSADARVPIEIGAPCPVLIFNDEDGRAKMNRQLEAIKRDFDLTRDEYAIVRQNLHAWSGCDDSSWTLVERNAAGKVVTAADFDRVSQYMDHYGIELLICDPLVRLHSDLQENDNGDMDKLTRIVRDLALKHNAAAILTHHMGKVTGQGMHSARGASALTAGWRVQLNVMPLEAELGPRDKDRNLIDEEILAHAVRLTVTNSNDGLTGLVGHALGYGSPSPGNSKAIGVLARFVDYHGQIRGSAAPADSRLEDELDRLGPTNTKLVDLYKLTAQTEEKTDAAVEAKAMELQSMGVPADWTPKYPGPRTVGKYRVHLEARGRGRYGGKWLVIDSAADFEGVD